VSADKSSGAMFPDANADDSAPTNGRSARKGNMIGGRPPRKREMEGRCPSGHVSFGGVRSLAIARPRKSPQETWHPAEG